MYVKEMCLGWYVMIQNRIICGPFKCRQDAERVLAMAMLDFAGVCDCVGVENAAAA